MQSVSLDLCAPVNQQGRWGDMTLRIRKLYNVLVVGGLLAACEKPHTPASEPAQTAPMPAPNRAEAAAPTTANATTEAAPSKVAEPPATPPTKVAEPTPEVAQPAPAKKVAKRRAPKADTAVPAIPPAEIGGGVRGWQ